jgi:hypothetical protein
MNTSENPAVALLAGGLADELITPADIDGVDSDDALMLLASRRAQLAPTQGSPSR